MVLPIDCARRGRDLACELVWISQCLRLFAILNLKLGDHVLRTRRVKKVYRGGEYASAVKHLFLIAGVEFFCYFSGRRRHAKTLARAETRKQVRPYESRFFNSFPSNRRNFFTVRKFSYEFRFFSNFGLFLAINGYSRNVCRVEVIAFLVYFPGGPFSKYGRWLWSRVDRWISQRKSTRKVVSNWRFFLGCFLVGVNRDSSTGCFYFFGGVGEDIGKLEFRHCAQLNVNLRSFSSCYFSQIYVHFRHD